MGVEITRRYTVAEAGLDTSTLPEGWEAGDGKLASAFVRATKPATAQIDASASATAAATRRRQSRRGEANAKGCAARRQLTCPACDMAAQDPKD